MSNSFTDYAQNFIKGFAPNNNQNNQNNLPNINIFVNNSNITIQNNHNNDNYNISSNKLLLLNRFDKEEEMQMAKTPIVNKHNHEKDLSLNEEIKRSQTTLERRDRRGVPIVKGSKKHKVTFKDKAGLKEKFVEKVEIESYKSINVYNTYGEGDNKKGTNSGSCCILI